LCLLLLLLLPLLVLLLLLLPLSCSIAQEPLAVPADASHALAAADSV
jgi:hypothetical protein